MTRGAAVKRGRRTQSQRRLDARLGQCYVLAGRAVAYGGLDDSRHPDLDGASLVHGTIQGFGAPRIGHAWVELPDGSVWEPITEECWPAFVFEAVFNPVPESRYTREELLTRLRDETHWGPWREVG